MNKLFLSLLLLLLSLPALAHVSGSSAQAHAIEHLSLLAVAALAVWLLFPRLQSLAARISKRQ